MTKVLKKQLIKSSSFNANDQSDTKLIPNTLPEKLNSSTNDIIIEDIPEEFENQVNHGMTEKIPVTPGSEGASKEILQAKTKISTKNHIEIFKTEVIEEDTKEFINKGVTSPLKAKIHTNPFFDKNNKSPNMRIHTDTGN